MEFQRRGKKSVLVLLLHSVLVTVGRHPTVVELDAVCLAPMERPYICACACRESRKCSVIYSLGLGWAVVKRNHWGISYSPAGLRCIRHFGKLVRESNNRNGGPGSKTPPIKLEDYQVYRESKIRNVGFNSSWGVGLWCVTAKNANEAQREQSSDQLGLTWISLEQVLGFSQKRGWVWTRYGQVSSLGSRTRSVWWGEGGATGICGDGGRL